jgi:RND family efflux transporter MFP subunit
MNTRTTAVRCALAAALLLLGACQKEAAPEPEVRPVRSIVVTSGSTGSSATYTAEIRSRYESDLGFQTAGKIIARPVDAGTTVKRNDVLARLDEQDLRLGVEAAQSSVNAAQAVLDKARSDEARFRDLLERGLTTRSTFLAQQTNTRTAQSQLDQARSELQLRRQQLGYAVLRADRDGVVTKVYQDVGAVVAAGQPVAAVAQPSELEAVFDVAENQIETVRNAVVMEIRIVSAPDRAFTGRVREISPSADPATRTYRVRCSISGAPASIRLGMTVSVAVRGASSMGRVVSVPATAIFQKDGKPAVWIVKKDLTVELRPVTVEQYDSTRALLSEGVQQEERIVTAGVHRLASGQKVRLLDRP